jgi:hypothetical protein
MVIGSPPQLFSFAAGYGNMIRELLVAFPTEEKAIREYIALCQSCRSYDLYYRSKVIRVTFIKWLVEKFVLPKFFKFAQVQLKIAGLFLNNL